MAPRLFMKQPPAVFIAEPLAFVVASCEGGHCLVASVAPRLRRTLDKVFRGEKSLPGFADRKARLVGIVVQGEKYFLKDMRHIF